MRNIIRYTAVLAAGMMLLGGCTFDERLTTPFKEGVPVNVVLGYEVAREIPLTRAEQGPEYENRVNNLYVFVFDGSGNRVWTTVNADNDTRLAFFSRTQEGSGIEDYKEGNGTVGNLTTGSVRFSVPSVQGATIVGIANLTAPGTGTAFEVTEDDMDKITTLDELESFVMYMPNHSVERNALFMMTGYAVDGSGNTSIDIAGSEGGDTELGCSIQLTRVDAKVVVNVTSRQGDATWSNFSFEPKTWQVINVPAQTYLLPYDEANGKTEEGPWKDNTGSHWDYSGQDAKYFDSQERPFERMTDKEVDNTQYYTGGSFIFYMPENRKRFRQEITETGPAGYALREESDQEQVQNPKPGQNYANGDFTYADPNSTYLLLTGYLSYTMADGTVVNTDARYIVHLGYCSGNPNDYDTKRNGKYTYNITVTGADDLIVEVTSDNNEERRPGYEGDVVYSSNKIFYLDSHYDRCLLEIHPSDVTGDMTWSVKTPFSTGVHDVDAWRTYDGVEDFRWIKFTINKKKGIRHGQYATYSGDNQYNSDWYPTSPDISQAKDLMDIDQLIAYLKLVKAQDENMRDLVADGTTDGHICITAFIDENLYYYDPINDQLQQNPQPQLWHQCVDREDRMLHIIVPDEDLTGGDYYSPDGNTSLVTSLYSFVQKSIRTVFDASNTQLQTAWGLESVMEGEDNGYNGRLPVGDVRAAVGNPDYNSNGRANSISWMVGKRWGDVIKTTERYGLNSGYNNAAYACLLRNRDLNGNGTVDAEEVRWYLAAIDQLTDIFLGEWALDEASRLYPYDPAGGDMPPTGKVYWHYTSSSPDPNQSNNPNVLWAEEGASRGNYGSSSGSGINGQYYAYRCVRNLGISLDNPDREPEDLVKVTDNGDGTYTIDLSRMNPKSLRTAFDNGLTLPDGHEKSPNNRPYKKFIVDKDIYGADPDQNVITFYNGESGAFNNHDAGYTWSNQGSWIQYQSPNTPCPSGYRVPNQRELLIMSSRLSKDQWPVYKDEDAFSYELTWRGWEQYPDPQEARWESNYMCQTSFSMKDISPYQTSDVTKQREGFMWIYSSGVFMLQNSRDEVGYVRCVKDTN